MRCFRSVDSQPVVFEEVERFVEDHRRCGGLVGDADPPTTEGYRLWVRCDCGASLERFVTPDGAAADLVRTRLTVLPN